MDLSIKFEMNLNDGLEVEIFVLGLNFCMRGGKRNPDFAEPTSVVKFRHRGLWIALDILLPFNRIVLFDAGYRLYR